MQEQRLRRPFPCTALTSGNMLAEILPGRVSGAARRRPAAQAPGRRFVLRCMIDTRALVRRAAPPSIWVATLSRRWPSGAVPNR